MYAVAPGHNVPLNELVAVRCRNGEVRSTERRYSDSGPKDVGPFSAPIFDLFPSREYYQSELTKFDLLENETAKVTWYTRDALFNWRRYNAIAVQPEPGEDGSYTRYFLRGFVVYLHTLEALEEP